MFLGSLRRADGSSSTVFYGRLRYRRPAVTRQGCIGGAEPHADALLAAAFRRRPWHFFPDHLLPASQNLAYLIRFEFATRPTQSARPCSCARLLTSTLSSSLEQSPLLREVVLPSDSALLCASEPEKIQIEQILATTTSPGRPFIDLKLLARKTSLQTPSLVTNSPLV